MVTGNLKVLTVVYIQGNLRTATCGGTGPLSIRTVSPIQVNLSKGNSRAKVNWLEAAGHTRENSIKVLLTVRVR